MKKLELTNFKNLPKQLSKEEIDTLFIQFKKGDMKAREQIINTNLRLVVKEVFKRYWSIFCDKNDLFEIGVIGLINAVDHFDMNKGICFSTYATTCIDNEIKNYLVKLMYNPYEFELNTPIKNPNNKNIYYHDLNEESFIKKIDDEMALYSLLNILSERNKKIIILYYGLFDNPKYNQKELAEMFHLSRRGISYIIYKSLDDMKEYALNNTDVKTNKKRI